MQYPTANNAAAIVPNCVSIPVIRFSLAVKNK